MIKKTWNIVKLGEFTSDVPVLNDWFPECFIQSTIYNNPEQILKNNPEEIILITDILWLNHKYSETCNELHKITQKVACWIVLTDKNTDYQDRLKWLHLGATSLIEKPIDANCLIAAVADTHSHYNEEKIRVMYLRSDIDAKQNHNNILESADIAVKNFSNYSSAFNAMDDYVPDLLLIDEEKLEGSLKDFTKLLKINRKTKDIPILHIAELNNDNNKTTTDRFIQRSIPTENLAETIRAKALQFRSKKYANEWLNIYDTKSNHEHDALRRTIDKHAIVSITNAAGIITHINERFCKISGYSEKELIGSTHRIVKSGLHGSDFYKDLWGTITQGNTWHGQVCNRSKNGNLYWVEATIVPILDEYGLPIQYLSIRTDISHLKELETLVRTQEEKYRSIFSAVAEGIVLVDIHRVIIDCNEAALNIFDVTKEEVIGAEINEQFLDYLELYWSDGRVFTAVDGPLTHVMVTGESIQNVELQLQHKDGKSVWLNMAARPIRNDLGQMIHIAISFSDISLIQETKNRLSASLGQLQATIKAIPDLLFELDSEGRYCSPPIGNQDLLLEKRELLVGKMVNQIFPPEAAANVMASITQAIQSGLSSGYEIWLDVPMGRRCFELSAARKEMASLERSRVVMLARDVTQRKSIENALRHSEQRLSLAIEGTGDGVWEWHIPTGAFDYSHLYAAIQGYEKDELPYHISSWMDHVHEEDISRITSILNEYLSGKRPAYQVELRIRCKNGNYKWVMCRATVTERDSDGTPQRVIGIHTDITQHKESEAQLLLFQQIFNSSQQCIAVADKNGKALFINQAYEKLMGFTLQDLEGKEFHRVASVDPVIGNTIRESVLIKKQPWTGMSCRTRKNGEQFYALNHYGLVEDSQGKISFIFVIFSDFTDELKKREMLSEALASAERANQAKSDFLSSMSHELRTPMNAILGFAQILEFDEELTADQLESVNEILKAGRHLLDLINEVLDLAKIESGKLVLSLEAIRLFPLVQECLQLIAPLANKRSITIELADFPEIMITADRMRLKQVIINILSNAVKYNIENGYIYIKPHIQDTESIRLEIEDTGLGISDKNLINLFQPFNRFEAEFSEIEGTGIGLAICKRLVEMMGGKIGVSSMVGQGSRFWVELPRNSQEETHENQALPQSNLLDTCIQNVKQTILCIDDNPVNLRLIKQILSRRSDIALITAHTPELGIEFALAHQPSLILVDINMPGMDGYQVLRVFQSNTSLENTPVIAVTANASPRDIEKGKTAGFADYITKPIDISLFIQKINDHLSAS